MVFRREANLRMKNDLFLMEIQDRPWRTILVEGKEIRIDLTNKSYYRDWKTFMITFEVIKIRNFSRVTITKSYSCRDTIFSYFCTIKIPWIDCTILKFLLLFKNNLIKFNQSLLLNTLTILCSIF